MAGTKKPRNKKYKPRPACLPITIRFNADNERELQIKPHAALANIKAGVADDEDWLTLCWRIDFGAKLAWNKEQPDPVKRDYMAAKEAMESIHARFKATQTWGGTGEEYNIIGEALNLTDEMQLCLPRRDLLVAMKQVEKEYGI